MSEESKQWYLMDRPLFNSGDESEEFYRFAQDGFQEVLESFIAKPVLVYDKTIHEDPKEIRAIIQNVTADAHNSTYIRQILCEIGNLHCGQYIECDGVMWLVASMPDNNQVYEKAVLWKCKQNVRFISPLTGEMVEYPVYSINSTQYGTGESTRQYITVGDAQHLIYIPYNEETVLMDDRARLLIDRNPERVTAFRITQVDTMSYAVGDELPEDGLLQWTVIETQYNAETDSADYMTADYKRKKVVGSTGIERDGIILYLRDEDGDGEITTGEEKQIRVSIGGKLLLDEDKSFEAAIESGDDYVEIRSVENNIITLAAIDNPAAVGKTAVLVVRRDTAEVRMSFGIVGW